MQILCMRHGHADAAGAAMGDGERPLSLLGQHQAREVGEALRAQRFAPSRVIASPLVRARQTAEIVAAQLGFSGEVELYRGLSYTASAAKASDHLQQLGCDRLLAVGHMPTLPETVARLCGGRGPGALGTAQVVCVDGGKLAWTLAPGDSAPRKL